MKMIKGLLLVIIIMIFVAFNNVDAAGVSIKSVKLVDHTGSAYEVSDAKPNGLNIKFDLSFSNVGDTAKYEVVLNNPTNKEYEIDTDKQFSGSNYISYSYELKDKTNRIKANSEVVLYITVKYENAVPADKLIDGRYVENNDMGINLLNEDNPDTFNNFLFIILMIVLMGVATLVFKYTKDKGLYIIVLSLMIVPITVFALEKLKLTVSTKITIETEAYDVYYSIGGVIKADQLDTVDYYEGCSPIKKRLEDNSYEDYLKCSKLYKKDSNKHTVGSLVFIKIDTISGITTTGACSYDSNDNYVCPERAFYNAQPTNYSYYCGVDLENNSYTSNFGDKLLNKCSEEEFVNMFGNLDYWHGDYGSINDDFPGSFIMPAHDVYINRYIIMTF